MRGTESEDDPARWSPSPYPLPRERVFSAGRFTDAAAKLAGMAGAVLGWRPEEFWGATPAELAAIVRAVAGDQVAAGPVDLARLMEMFPDG